MLLLCLVLLCVAVLCNHLPLSSDSNWSFYLIHSSNGKSVSWSESGPRHPPRGGNVWHRLSVHVRKQEAGLNQTAVIRPLTNTPDPHSCEPSTCDLGTDPLPPRETRGAKPLLEEDDQSHSQCHLQPPPHARQRHVLESDEEKPTSYSHLKGYGPERSRGTLVDTHSSHAPTLSDHTAKEAMPANQHLTLTPSQSPLTQKLGSFEERVSEDEELDLLHSYIYDAKAEEEGEEEEEEEEGGDDDFNQTKANLEDSLVLSPPSPFRDSVCSGESASGSPVMEPMLGKAPSSFYTSDIYGDYAHSSSTL